MTDFGFDLQGRGMTSRRTRERLVERLRSQGVHDERVLERMRAVPRHIFVDEALSHRAYEDTALPIGAGQTISQPFIVGLMTQMLLERDAENEPEPSEFKVLEVGTGCGYQTAILSGLVGNVYSIERLDVFRQSVRRRFSALRINNVTTRIGDGYAGWERFAPFNRILVAAAPASVPAALVEQLADFGRLIIPVGESEQQLQVVRRTPQGLVQDVHEAVRFVPLLPGSASGA